MRRLVALAQEPEKFETLAQPPPQDLGLLTISPAARNADGEIGGSLDER
jgi:hypothetical protein